MEKPLKIAGPPDKIGVWKTSKPRFWLGAMKPAEVTSWFFCENAIWNQNVVRFRYSRTDVIYVAVD